MFLSDYSGCYMEKYLSEGIRTEAERPLISLFAVIQVRDDGLYWDSSANEEIYMDLRYIWR